MRMQYRVPTQINLRLLNVTRRQAATIHTKRRSTSRPPPRLLNRLTRINRFTTTNQTLSLRQVARMRRMTLRNLSRRIVSQRPSQPTPIKIPPMRQNTQFNKFMISTRQLPISLSQRQHNRVALKRTTRTIQTRRKILTRRLRRRTSRSLQIRRNRRRLILLQKPRNRANTPKISNIRTTTTRRIHRPLRRSYVSSRDLINLSPNHHRSQSRPSSKPSLRQLLQPVKTRRLIMRRAFLPIPRPTNDRPINSNHRILNRLRHRHIMSHIILNRPRHSPRRKGTMRNRPNNTIHLLRSATLQRL